MVPAAAGYYAGQGLKSPAPIFRLPKFTPLRGRKMYIAHSPSIAYSNLYTAPPGLFIANAAYRLRL